MADHRIDQCCERCTRAGRSGLQAADWHHDLYGLAATVGALIFILIVAAWLIVQWAAAS